MNKNFKSFLIRLANIQTMQLHLCKRNVPKWVPLGLQSQNVSR